MHNEVETKEALLAPKLMAKDDKGVEFPVCLAELETKKLRNTTTALLRILDPKAWATYKEMKASNPTLAGKRAAYIFAFARMMEIGYNISGL